MRGKYKAAFLLPEGASKCLGEDGWEFNSENYVSDKIENFLKNTLGLKFLKSDLGIVYYVNDCVQASVFYDEEEKNIEHIFFQIYDENINFLKQKYIDSDFDSGTELFIPN